MPNISEVYNIVGAHIQNMMSTVRGIPNAKGETEDGSRNLWTLFKYRKNPTFRVYYEKYSRGDIAHRIVTDPAQKTWRDNPTIEGREDGAQIIKASGGMGGLEDADVLNRIGNFSVLFVGVPDGGNPEEPLGVVSGGNDEANWNAVYYTAYAEDGITVESTVSDPMDPRYGLPEYYTLSVQNRDQQDRATTTGSIRAHWSRCVHMAEGALSNKVQGLSSLAPVLNRLDDLEKTVGGSAEGFFRVGQGAWTFEIDPAYATNAKDDPESANKLKMDAENFTNGWQRFLMLFGMSAKPVDVQVPDSSKATNDALLLIAGATGIPLRILTGQGGGQTTGQEDKASYNDVIRDRQQNFGSQAYRDLWDIFARAGMLEPLALTDKITWETFEASNAKDEAEIMRTKADALLKVSNALTDMGGITGMVDKAKVIEDWLGIEVSQETGGDD